MLRFRRVLAAALVVPGVLACSGCVDTSQMQFVKDDRLTFQSPDDYELTELPLTVSWTMEDFEVLPKPEKPAKGGKGAKTVTAADVPEPTEDAGYFAVFVDRAPIKPGRTLEDVGDGDPLCEGNPACPDKTYLEAEGVYTTRKPTITLELVKALSSKEKIQLHQVTVIVLDSEGRRIGETAWFRYFKLENKVLDQ